MKTIKVELTSISSPDPRVPYTAIVTLDGKFLAMRHANSYENAFYAALQYAQIGWVPGQTAATYARRMFPIRFFKESDQPQF